MSTNYTNIPGSLGGGGGGTVTGTGTATQIAIWDSATNLTSSSGLSFASGVLSISDEIDIQELSFTRNGADDFRFDISATDILWLSTAQVSLGSHLIPINDNVLTIGANGGNRFKELYLSSYASVGLDSPGNSVVYVVGDGANPLIILKSTTGSQVELRGSNQVLDINNTTSATPGASVLTFTNGPAGTAGNPDIYLHISVNGTLYAFPGFAV